MKKFGEGQQPFHAIIDIPEGDSQELTTVTDQAMNSLYGELFNLLQIHGINPTTTTNADLKQVARAVWAAVNAGNLFLDSGTANVKNLMHYKGERYLFKNGNSDDNGFIIEFLNKVENTGEVTINVFDVERNENHFNNARLVDTNKKPLSAKFLPANSMVKAYYEYEHNQFVIINIYNTTTMDNAVYNAENIPLRNVNITTIDSIDGLKNLTKVNGRTVFVKSFYQNKGVGGGFFVYDATKTTINNQGTIIEGWVKQNKNPSVLDFGAIGDGELHTVQEWLVSGRYTSLAAIQAHYPFVTAIDNSIDWVAAKNAADNNNVLNFRDSRYHYVFNKTLFCNDNQQITGSMAKIRQVKPQTQLFDFSEKKNIKLTNLHLVGIGKDDFANSAGSRSDGIYAINAENIMVKNNLFEALSHSAMTCTYSKNIKFLNNTVYGLGDSVLVYMESHSNDGVVIDVGCKNSLVEGNSFINLAMGIQTGNLNSDVKIINNYFENIIGQHCIYTGATQKALTITGNQINKCSLIGIKVQTYDVESDDSFNIVIANNSTRETGADGIVVINTDVNPVYKNISVVITGNAITKAGQDGIITRNVSNGIVANNVINTAERDGISFDTCNDLLITSNTITNTNRNGIRETGSNKKVIISNNKITDPARGGIAGYNYGIYLPASSEDMTISHNDISATNGKMRYGLLVEAGIVSTYIVQDNNISGATESGIRKVNTAVAFKYFANNLITNSPAYATGLSTTVLQTGNAHRDFFTSELPTTGNFTQGDFVKNILPNAQNGVVIVGWLRLTTGSTHALGTDWVAIKQSI